MGENSALAKMYYLCRLYKRTELGSSIYTRREWATRIASSLECSTPRPRGRNRTEWGCESPVSTCLKGQKSRSPFQTSHLHCEASPRQEPAASRRSARNVVLGALSMSIGCPRISSPFLTHSASLHSHSALSDSRISSRLAQASRLAHLVYPNATRRRSLSQHLDAVDTVIAEPPCCPRSAPPNTSNWRQPMWQLQLLQLAI